MRNSIFFSILLLIMKMTSCISLSEKSIPFTPSLVQYQFSEVDSLMLEEERPIAVFLHATWCKYCRNMEQTTFQNKEVIQVLNEKYYFISFDGEHKESVLFRNRWFKYIPNGRNTGTHELAIALATIDRSLVYPSFVVLNSDYEIIFQYGAFLESVAMKKILEEGKGKIRK